MTALHDSLLLLAVGSLNVITALVLAGVRARSEQANEPPLWQRTSHLPER